MHRQKIWRELEFPDELELFLDGFADLLRGTVGEMAPCTTPSQILKMLLRSLARRHRLVRIFVLEITEREAASFDDIDRAFERRFMASEQTRHLFRAFDVPLGIGFEAKTGLAKRRLLANTGDDVLQRTTAGLMIEHVIGRDDWRATPLAKRGQRRNPRPIIPAIGMRGRKIKRRIPHRRF